MQVMIEIDEKDFLFFKTTSFIEDEKVMFNQSWEDRMMTLALFGLLDCVKNSIVLPPNHGRLIDEKDLLGRLEIYNTKNEMDQAHYRFSKTLVGCTPAVIPAVKEDKK